MSSSDKIAVFIDGANLYATAKTLGFDIDYKRLLEEFQSRGTLLRAFFYTAIAEDQECSALRPLIDWLAYNGFTVVAKATKEFNDASGRRKVRGNMDIELAVDAMELAKHVDQMVLFSGNGNFRSLVEAMQSHGVSVTVISSIATRPPMIADELRRQADVFTDLTELQSKIGRDPSKRSAPRNHRNSCTVVPRFSGTDVVHHELSRAVTVTGASSLAGSAKWLETDSTIVRLSTSSRGTLPRNPRNPRNPRSRRNHPNPGPVKVFPIEQMERGEADAHNYVPLCWRPRKSAHTHSPASKRPIAARKQKAISAIMGFRPIDPPCIVGRSGLG
jgi:uncharacterized LabA/DUF88 family protein